jgi:hypothetical protein
MLTVQTVDGFLKGEAQPKVVPVEVGRFTRDSGG